jgi:ComF family protein
MEIIENILDFIYPPRCPICKEIIPWHQEKKICSSCLETLPFIEGPVCERCSKPIYNENNKYCYDCSKKEHNYKKGWSLWLYEEPIKSSIHAFKDHHKKEYGKLFAKELARFYGNEIRNYDMDVIVPVPSHKGEIRRRGYNQAEVLAEELSRLLEIPCLNLLKKNKSTLPQKGLNDVGRRRNLNGAFVLNNQSYSFKNILLVDDIYTTGSTIDVCSKVLKQNKEIQVFFISLCIGRGY